MHVTGTIEKIISTTIGTHNDNSTTNHPYLKKVLFHISMKSFIFIWMDGWIFLRDDFFFFNNGPIWKLTFYNKLTMSNFKFDVFLILPGVGHFCNEFKLIVTHK